MIEDVSTATASPEVDESAAPQAFRDTYQDFAAHVRKHPLETVLAVAAVGFVVGLAMYATRPEPTLRERFSSMLDEFEGRLKEQAGSASRKAAALAGEGLSAVQGAACSAESGIRSLANEAVHRFRRLFR